MRAGVKFAALAAALATGAGPAAGEPELGQPAPVPRIALVMWADVYGDPAIARVPTAAGDARLIADRLHTLKYDVILRDQVSYGDILAELKALADGPVRTARQAGQSPIVVIYFVGHGFASEGTTFMAGKDARNASLIHASVSAREVQQRLGRQALTLMLLDVCRTPLQQSGAIAADDPLWADDAAEPASAGVVSGAMPAPAVAPAPPQPWVEEWGIGYATGYPFPARGQAASGAAHGPFAEALDQLIGGQGDTAHDDLVEVSRVIEERTHALWPNESLKASPDYRAGKFHIAADAAADQAADAAWRSLMEAPTREGVMNFVFKHRGSPWVAAAERWLSDSAGASGITP